MTGKGIVLVRIAGLVFLLAACGGGGEAATTTAAPTTSTTVATTTTTVATTTTTTAATTTTASPELCPEAAAPPAGWRFLQTSLWKFYHPGDWEDVTTRVPTEAKTAGYHFDAVTLAEAGVDQSEVLESFAVASPDFQQNLLMLRLDGPTSSLEDIYQRAEERYRQSPDFEEMIAAGVTDCLGGEPALHVGFMTAGAYQQSWFSLHGDTLFHADFFGQTADDGALIADMFSTFEWIEPAATGPIGDAFVEYAMANTIDTSAGSPDSAWYTDSFTTQDTAIYAIFRLESGLTGLIEAVWTYEGDQILLTHSFTYEVDDSWGYMGMTAPSDGFTPGDYQLELTLDGDAARVVFDFTVAQA